MHRKSIHLYLCFSLYIPCQRAEQMPKHPVQQPL